jgi:hypothetical protein
MLNLGLPTGVASSIDVRLKTTVGKGSPVYSQIQKISVTPYALVYMYAPGAYQVESANSVLKLQRVTESILGILISHHQTLNLKLHQ